MKSLFLYPAPLNNSVSSLLTDTSLRIGFQCRVIFTCSTYVKFTFANKIEAMHERLLVSVEVEARSLSRLSSALCFSQKRVSGNLS